jgi:hypothetical protein
MVKDGRDPTLADRLTRRAGFAVLQARDTAMRDRRQYNGHGDKASNSFALPLARGRDRPAWRGFCSVLALVKYGPVEAETCPSET